MRIGFIWLRIIGLGFFVSTVVSGVWYSTAIPSLPLLRRNFISESVYTSISQTGFHRTSSGVPRDIAE
jgi:hypothetical protein